MRMVITVIMLALVSQVFAQDATQWRFIEDRPESLSVGDTLSFTVARTYAPGYNWSIQPDPDLLSILEPIAPVFSRDSLVTGEVEYQVTQSYIFWGFKPDTFNPIRFQLENADKTDSTWFVTTELIIDPKLFSSPFDSMPRAEKSIYETTRPWYYYALWVLALILVAWVAWLMYKRYMDSHQRPVDTSIIIPEKAAIDRFRESMADLENRREAWTENVKAFYSELIDIYKTYLHEKQKINVLEMTTEETLAWMKTDPDVEGSIQNPHDIFNRADLIKFAKQSGVMSQMVLDVEAIWKSVSKIEAIRPTHFNDQMQPEAVEPVSSPAARLEEESRS